MKKIFALLMVAAMLFCMTAGLSSCADGEDNASGASSTASEESKETPKENTLVCGITLYKPMNYYDDNNVLTGFDTEFAKLVGEKIDMEVKFQQIEWGNKYMELESGSISCIWNGFTANSEDDGKKRSERVDFSYGYMLNQQCIVIKDSKKDEINSEESLAGLSAAAESGSAGAAYAEKAVGEDGEFISVSAQTNAFTEVKSGAVDFAVIDILLAQSTVGQGSYSDLVIADIELESEIYAIGFPKGSELTSKVNAAIKELYDDGTLTELAEKYGLENSLKISETID